MNSAGPRDLADRIVIGADQETMNQRWEGSNRGKGRRSRSAKLEQAGGLARQTDLALLLVSSLLKDNRNCGDDLLDGCPSGDLLQVSRQPSIAASNAEGLQVLFQFGGHDLHVPAEGLAEVACVVIPGFGPL